MDHAQNMMEGENDTSRPSLRDLFPKLSDDQLAEVEDTFYGYLEIAWRIYERLEREGKLDEILKNLDKPKFDSSQGSAQPSE